MWINFQESITQRLELEQLNQEQIRAKNLRSKGAAIVRGVAGSGKSLILRNRVEKLSEDFEHILVLTYNRFMNGWLNHQLSNIQINKIECKTFHQWAYKYLKYSYEDDPSKIIDLAHKSTKKYQAILIDEAQDFHDQWFQALLPVLDNRTQALFIVYDNTQSVYGQSHRRQSDWSWKSLGITIPGGRSQVFDLNYRNSPEILELAWKFIQPSLETAGIKVEKRQRDDTGKIISTPNIGSVIEPRKKLSRSSGIQPLLLEVYYENMPDKIAYQVQSALQTHPDSSIGILVHPQAQDLKSEISKELTTFNIEHHAPETSRDRDGNVVSRPYIIVDSWNALKGVEFDAVIIAGVDSLSSYKSEDSDTTFEAISGLYTAMTRAKDHLVMLYENKDIIVELIETALNSPDCLDSET
jgi:superfamily I DNA/RNA helicase